MLFQRFNELYPNHQTVSPRALSVYMSEENDSDEKGSSSTSPSKVEKPVSPLKLTREKINIATKDMLVAYCKAKGIKQSGKKEEVVARLLELLEKEEKSENKDEVIEKPKLISSSKSSSSTLPILKTISEKSEKIEIRKNKFGNMEHFETGLVFDKESSYVVGVQNTNGKIDSLIDKTIELCKKFKFKYNIPENLSVDKGLNSVKVEELDEEDEEELDEDDIEEEEEDLENEVDLEDD
jgi:hypothetical protein